MCLGIGVSTLLGQHRIEELKKWLEQSDRGEIGQQKFAAKPLSKEEAILATEVIYRHKLKEIRDLYGKQWQDKKLREGKYEMRFEYRVLGEKPEDGRSLYISMHGGGNTAAAMNDQQWRNQIHLYTPKEGVYIAPRAAVDDWNMWFQPHVDTLFDRMIQTAVALMDVNPDKVYLLGYSAGGDGAYRMGPRMADRWAAVSMMAGHPGDVSPVNLRNIGFSLWMGERDAAYNRNAEAVKFGQRMDSLHRADPEGYFHETHIEKGKGHWMDRRDTVAIPWMAKFRRNSYPEKVVWRQDDTPHDSFYWLSVPIGEAKKGNLAVVECKDNVVTIRHNDYNTLMIGLNDEMIDYSKPVEVVVNAKTVFKKKLNRKLETVYKSIEKRGDSRLVFSTNLKITDNEKITVSDNINY